MGDPKKSKPADPGLVTVVIALILGGTWAAYGIYTGTHERKSVEGLTHFLIAFGVLLLVARLLKLRR